MGKLRISPTKIKELKYLPYYGNIKIDGICVPSFRITDCLAWRFGIGRSQILPAKWLDWKPKTHSMDENQWPFYDRSRPLPSSTLRRLRSSSLHARARHPKQPSRSFIAHASLATLRYGHRLVNTVNAVDLVARVISNYLRLFQVFLFIPTVTSEDDAQWQMAVCQNLVPLVNIKIAGKWMFIPLKMVLIGIDP